MPTSVRKGVYRPLGLILAVAATALVYGVTPLLNLYFMWRVGNTAEGEFKLGGIGITAWDWLSASLGAVILIVCILAWWGRPAWIRFVLMGLLLLLAAVNLYRIGEVLTTSVDPLEGGQAEEIQQNLFTCWLPGLLLVPLYVVWYLNRAPARAFYRRVPLTPGDQK
jgi:hypothetical protein